MKIITTWVYSHKKGDKSNYPQLGSKISSQKFQNYYWRCIICLFESSNRLNTDTRHILFCNERPPEKIDGKDVYKLLEQFRVERYDFRTITRPLDDYYKAWNSQFLVLDIIDSLSKITNPEDIFFILDSDCLFNKPIPKELEEDVKKYKYLTYTLNLPADEKMNGFNLSELKKLAQEYGGLEIEKFFYNGGEIICCLQTELSIISRIARDAYKKSLERYKEGKTKFNEEAQLLSYVHHRLGYTSHTANKYIKRIWTDANYSDVPPNAANFTIWHLPSEKKRGFVKRFNDIDTNQDLSYDPKYWEMLFLTPATESRLRKIMRKTISIVR